MKIGAKMSLNIWKHLQQSPIGLYDDFGMFWNYAVVISLIKDYIANFPILLIPTQEIKNPSKHYSVEGS